MSDTIIAQFKSSKLNKAYPCLINITAIMPVKYDNGVSLKIISSDGNTYITNKALSDAEYETIFNKITRCDKRVCMLDDIVFESQFTAK